MSDEEITRRLQTEIAKQSRGGRIDIQYAKGNTNNESEAEKMVLRGLLNNTLDSMRLSSGEGKRFQNEPSQETKETF